MPPYKNESISFLGHATVRLDLGGARLLTDPLLRDRFGHVKRRSAPIPASAYADLDGVLISHLHLDHLHPASLRRLPRDVPVVVPRGGGAMVARLGFGDVREVVEGDRVTIGGVDVLAVHAVHDDRRWPGGTRADALGYVAHGAARVYFAGDTDVYPEMEALAPLDVALVPVWGWGPNLGSGHLDPEGAARALELLRPRIAIPIHWGTFFPILLGRGRGDRLVDPPHEFARHVERLTPEVRVEILEPGATLELDATPGPAASSGGP
jgi:L-ascorbate metabolism protein UlaG (beta-lactamase superfamily)